jgi:DNA-binding CsgD family transcriptional regulator
MSDVVTPSLGLVGRERECGVVATLIDETRHGRSGSLVIRGEPGIGKSALLEHAAGLADGMIVLRAVGVVAESDLAFAGLFGLLQPIMDRLDQLVETQARALENSLGLTGSSGADRFLISAAVLSLLAAAAEERPVLCLVDDAQWLDRPSVDALSFAARRLGADPVAIVFGAREGEAQSFDGSGIRELVLAGIEEDAARSLLVQHQREMSSGVRARLLAEAEGNPLALRELPAGLTDDQLAGREPLPEAIPLTPRLESLYRRQIEPLPSSTQAALLIAAVESTGDLSAVAGALAQFGLGTEALAPAERLGLITILESTIAFRHPLVRAAAYEAAPLSERQRAHTAVARVLAGDQHADRRVWHLAMATVTGDEEVAAALEASARAAQFRGGHASAASAFRRAAELSQDESRRSSRLAAAAQSAWDAGQADSTMALIIRALPGASGTSRARLLYLRGLLESRRGETSESVKTLTQALETSTDPSLTAQILHDAVDAASDVGDRAALRAFAERAATLPEQTAPDRFNKMTVAGYAALGDGDYERAHTAFGEALATAGQLDDPTALLWAARAASLGYETGAGLPFAARAVELARRQGTLSLLPLALDQLGSELFRASQFEQAYAVAEEGYRLSLDLAQGHVACHLDNMASVEAVYGREADARDHAQEAITIARRDGPRIESSVRATIARLELSLGRVDQAASILLELVTNLKHYPLPHQGLTALPDAVEAVVRSGRGAAALADPLARYRDWVRAVPDDARRALLARCEALTEARPPEQAFGEAIALADALPAFERARTELLYGEWLRRQRRRTDARPHLRDAQEQFEILGASPWAARAERELRASGETARKREPSTLDQLTPRERTIAEMAGTGLTNPEIGAQLFLSPRTVEYHLGKVFSKLGIASRAELIRRGPPDQHAG